MRAPPATCSQPLLSLKEATFRLGEQVVFPNTNWRFARGEHWAVIGPNGSGKSLFADALRGQVPLVHGELQYHLQPPAGLSPEDTIGHVTFEERKLEIHDLVLQSRWNSLEEEGALRVRDFLSYERVMDVNPFEVTGRHEHARPRFEHRMRRAVSLLRVEPFLDRTLFSLSNGERQRIQLARALCHPLRLLILDEPYTGLDAQARNHFDQVLERLMDTSLRVLLLTTQSTNLPRHITHVLRLEACQVLATGPRARMLRLGSDRRQLARVKVMKSAKHAALTTVPTSRGHPLVRLENVTVRYGEKTVLQNLNWIIHEGESWALLGPNGSGKTTLLSLISGDHPQVYMNQVEVFGKQRGTGESIWDLKRRIGWLSPELQLHFDDAITCFEAVVSGFQETIGVFEPPSSRQRAAARQWLGRFQLLGLVPTPLFALSAGQQRMVLLARALVKQPRLLILDEPCLNLDAAHRELIVRTIDDLIRQRAVTVIYVTHRPREIPSAIKRVLRLKKVEN